MLTLLVKLIALLGFGVMFVWTLITGREAVPLTERTQVITVSEETRRRSVRRRSGKFSRRIG
jgi:hypothetical protein